MDMVILRQLSAGLVGAPKSIEPERELGQYAALEDSPNPSVPYQEGSANGTTLPNCSVAFAGDSYGPVGLADPPAPTPPLVSRGAACTEPAGAVADGEDRLDMMYVARYRLKANWRP